MPTGLKGDDAELRRKVLAELVESRARGGMKAIPRSARDRQKKNRKIADVAQGFK